MRDGVRDGVQDGSETACRTASETASETASGTASKTATSPWAITADKQVIRASDAPLLSMAATARCSRPQALGARGCKPPGAQMPRSFRLDTTTWTYGEEKSPR